MGKCNGTAVSILLGLGVKRITPYKNVEGRCTTFLISQFFSPQERIGSDAFFNINEYSKYIFKT